MNTALEQIWHTWSNGGWVMAALALLAITTYTSAVHLLMTVYYRGITRVSDLELRGWVSDAGRAPAAVRELIRYTQDQVHSLRDIEGRFREVEAAKTLELDRRLAFVKIMVISAPLFGLLGTVLGMLLTFRAIGVGGSSTSEVIAKGISEALVATQTGMIVAIPGLMMAYLAKRWRNDFVTFVARLESITLRHFRQQLHGMTRQFVRRGSRAAVSRASAAAEMPLPAGV
jgi:biopolymer transport protein ExbB